MDKNYSIIKAHGGHRSIFEAVYMPTGLRSRFICVEHINVGKAWIMRDIEGLLPGPVIDESLTELKSIAASRNKLEVEPPFEFSC